MGSISTPHFGHAWSPSTGSTGAGAGSQFFRGMEPIFFGRSDRTASGLPEFISERSNVSMSECGEAMFIRGCLSILMTVWGVLPGLSRMLVSRQLILFSLLFANTMCVCRAIVQFFRSLMVLEV
jgi:hypothetical protein